MADNNAFYPGYFPGDAQPRRPSAKGMDPAEYNFDQITNIIDGVAADYGLVMTGMPRWIADRALDDWKQTLKVSIKSKDVDVKDLDDYDPSSMPGAFGIGINLNPIDWFTEPKPGKPNELQKTLQNWWKAGVNWHDIETRYRRDVWGEVFDRTAGSPRSGAAYHFPFENDAVKALGENIGATVGLSYGPSANPLGIKERGIYDEDPIKKTQTINDINPILDAAGNVTGVGPAGAAVPKRLDVMEEFANNVGNFEIMGGFGVKRESKYDDVAFSGYRAAVTEMEKHRDSGAIGAITSVGALISGDADLQAAIEVGRARVKIIDSMKGTSHTLTGDDGFTEKIEKAILKGTKLNLDDVKKAQSIAVKNLANIDATVAGLAARAGTAVDVDFIKKYTEPYKKQVENLLKNPVMDIAARANVAGLTPGQIADLTRELESTNLRSTLTNVKRQLSGGAIGKPLKGGDPLTVSIERTFIRDSANDIMYPEMRRGAKTMGKVIKAAEEVDGTIASRAIRGGLNFTKNTSQSMTTLDLLEAFEKGNIMERYLWPRIRGYIEAYTPAAYTEKFLKNNHYFGLDLGDSKDADFEKYMSKGVLRGPKSLLLGAKEATGEAPRGVFGNYFTISDTAAIGGTGVSINARLYGGSHFTGLRIPSSGTAAKDMKTVEKLAELWGQNKLSTADFKRLMGVTDTDSLVKTLGWLNAKGITLEMPGGLKLDNIDDLDAFAKSIAKFKDWADGHKSLIKTNVSQDSGEYYAALATLLNNQNKNPDFANLGIYSRYVGGMQKLYYKFNSIQSALLKTRVGKALAFVAFGRKQFVDRVSALLAKALTAIIGSASGGLLAEIAPVIERVLRIVLNFILDKTTEIIGVFAKAITQADINGIFKYIDKSVEQSAKILLAIMGFFAILFILPANAFVGGVATSFSPVDNTKLTGIKDLFPEGMNLGNGVALVATSSSKSSVSCFDYNNTSQSLTPEGSAPIQLGSWPPDVKTLMEDSLKIIQGAGTDGYLQRLCEKGSIGLWWAPPVPSDQCVVPPGCHEASCMPPGCADWCGLTTQSLGFGTATDNIIFGGACSFNPPENLKWYYAYLFAHESGHVYDNRLAGYDYFGTYTFEGAITQDAGTLDTYPIGEGACSKNNSEAEDYAETVGDYVAINTKNCPNTETDYTTWWNLPGHKYHYEYAKNVLMRPYAP